MNHIKKIVSTALLMLISVFFMSIDEPKLGKVTMDDILAASPEWKEAAQKYIPAMDEIDYLARLVLPVKIEVYYGHWCSDSVNNIPRFMRIIELAANPIIETEYWSVARTEKGREREPVNNRKLERIPTFVVFVEGKEAGQIIENPVETIEKDLVAIIKKTDVEE